MTRLLASLGLSLMVLAGCGNNADKPVDFAQVKSAVTGLFKRGEAQPAGVTVDQIAAALAASPRPHAFVTLESRKAQSLVIEIGQNGPYSTYSTSDRQTITMRSGMITATRGLGGDLMSSDEDALLALVRAAQPGQARYGMRFLDGENQTRSRDFLCTVTPGGTAPVALGEIDTVARVVTAKCTATGGTITNTFLVDGAGNILSARQWIGNFTGYMAVQQLRL